MITRAVISIYLQFSFRWIAAMRWIMRQFLRHTKNTLSYSYFNIARVFCAYVVLTPASSFCKSTVKLVTYSELKTS